MSLVTFQLFEWQSFQSLESKESEREGPSLEPAKQIKRKILTIQNLKISSRDKRQSEIEYIIIAKK